MTLSRFTLVSEPMKGLCLYQMRVLGDERGSLTRLFCQDALRDTVFASQIAQINLTRTTRKGTVRGLHFQHPPHCEDKLVSCIRGKIEDFVVDLRKGSQTFLNIHREVLSAENARALLIPKGFAHGFQTLSEHCELLYLHSAPYVPEAEDGLLFEDALLNIDLPLPITDRSQRDTGFARIGPDFEGLTP